MKRIMGLFLGLIALVSIQSCESNRKANNYNGVATDNTNVQFVKNAAELSMTNVKASGLAISNSKNQQVVQFAKAMITDYTQLNDELKKLKLDTTAVDTIVGEHQLILDSLGMLHAAQFDKSYMQLMISNHEKQVSSFRAASQDKNTPVADFAKKITPALNVRLDSARVINNSLK
ncbi:putative membrane protein [Mucilaginibacter pineti]|uniref:Putative membrane protein n=1 Tax=Mucilaginibacter pineti TaxID=1391627 RepID=A0A1G6UTM8_9SPHI|nr:DUF4142 domain-containing protein [Mucilaginibacter pineti]SDD44653.1 putative membrane protein [Mucilaginibacter pineti]